MTEQCVFTRFCAFRQLRQVLAHGHLANSGVEPAKSGSNQTMDAWTCSGKFSLQGVNDLAARQVVCL